uniref:Ribonuclease H-like domain-containing protein n=1 Tax=Tanacetum cinerariifolium TaxID=118510 RepID=A0A6L2NXY1_TANCI|nr:ribonuclease H-like domain-containing protein [Tanacetum cinerariifolium]
MPIPPLSLTHEPTTPSLTSNTHITSPAITAHGNALTANTHHMVTRAKVEISKPLARMNCHATTTSPIPCSHLHAHRDPNWHKAMVDEYNALILNRTWALMPRPANVNIVRSMWLFKHKFNADGSLSSAVLHYFIHCNPCKTPVDTESKLGSDGYPVSDPTLFRSLAGFLQYLTFTRPDISYVVKQLCLYMHDPHFTALKHILRYVRGTIDHGLHLYVSSTSQLTAYTDADWAGCHVTRRSTFGYYVFLGDNLLSWSAKRQVTLSRSSAEAEYRGVANIVAETVWIQNLLLELHAPLSTATLI